ncbi:MAG: class I SAM-dependent methyltransferase, partial [Aquabacterium sp.]|nr:class I SAM-dependent methyltransferase [Aquabacterium sp.]
NLPLAPAIPSASGGADRASNPGYDLITSRAFASLPDFTRLSAHLLAPGGVWMAMKGKPPDDEQAALPPGVEVFHVEHLQVPGLDAQRCLVWMRRKTT